MLSSCTVTIPLYLLITNVQPLKIKCGPSNDQLVLVRHCSTWLVFCRRRGRVVERGGYGNWSAACGLALSGVTTICVLLIPCNRSILIMEVAVEEEEVAHKNIDPGKLLTAALDLVSPTITVRMQTPPTPLAKTQHRARDVLLL